MKYYTYLDLPGWQLVSNKINHYLEARPNLWDEKSGAWAQADLTDIHRDIPELAELFRPLNLTIRFVAFVTMSLKQLGIHRDGGVESCRINIPIKNCEGSVTRFYTATKPPTVHTYPNGVSYRLEDAESCVHVASAEVIKPTLLRVHEPHSVNLFHENYPRITCTISFNEDLEHLLA